ncbi:MAG: CocE/NonD family hydrolase [Rickettsiales bacterium]
MIANSLSRMVCRGFVLLVLSGFLTGLSGGVAHTAPPVEEAALVRSTLILPTVIDGNEYALDMLILAPPGPGPFPLAVIAHGSPRNPSARRRMTTLSFLPQATEFARRGYHTAVFMRRGYGRSDGEWAEEYGECDFAYYAKAAAETSKDIVGVIGALKARPDVDAGRILVVGRSAGGLGAVATAAANPGGVLAAINFAGGRGSRRAGEVCSEDELVDAFETFGETARIPMLWVYAENDGYFRPDLARRFHAEFTEGGGRAQLVLTGPFGADGHTLFSGAGIPVWRPLVDDFLRQTGLPNWDAPPPLPAVPDIAPPQGLSEKGQEHWRRYLAAPENKAFVKSRSGERFGWRSGRNTPSEAEAGALGNCRADDCEVVSVNGSAPK